MPYGFAGNASVKYLEAVAKALSAAQNAHSVNPFSGCSSGAVPPPSLSTRYNQNPPCPPDAAMSGAHQTGVGNQTNIVSDRSLYDTLLHKINETDNRMAEVLYHTAMEIEGLCATSFIVPETLPGYLAILNAVKSSLGEFRTLTNEAEIKARRFAEDITVIE